jgi:hypothetical protein
MLLLLALVWPATADILTFNTTTTAVLSGDLPRLDTVVYEVFPGFDPYLGSLTAVTLTDTLNLDQKFVLSIGGVPGATVSGVFVTQESFGGPSPYYTNSIRPPGLFFTPSFAFAGNPVPISGVVGPDKCVETGSPCAFIFPVVPEATNQYDFTDLSPFTSDRYMWFSILGSFTQTAGSPQNWFGEYIYSDTITYTYTPTPEPSGAALAAIVILCAFSRFAVRRAVRPGRRASSPV